MGKIYRTSIRMDKQKEKQLKLLANERGLSINKFFNIIIEEIIERYHPSDDILFEDLKKTFILLESKITIDLKPQEKKYTLPLKTYIYNKYTQEDQRLGLYLKILNHQILSEWRFLDLFFNRSDSDDKFEITYGDYYVASNDGDHNTNSIHNKFEKNFLKAWFFELKQYNIVQSLDDINRLNFNYKSLERLIFKFCKFKITKKERRINFKNELVDAKQRKYLDKFFLNESKLSVKKEIINRFDGFMKIILGEIEGLDLNLIEFKPHIIFTKVLDIEKFLEFIENNGSMSNFINVFKTHFDNYTITYEINALDSSFEESYEKFMEFMNKFREIYRIMKTKTILLPNFFKSDRLKYELLNLSLKKFNLFKELLTSFHFDEIDYYTDDMNGFFVQNDYD